MFRILITTCLFSAFMLVSPVKAENAADYPKTVNALLERYKSERQTVREYRAFADKAMTEKLPNIAHLLRAMALSESIHAENCKRLLDRLGVATKEAPGPAAEVLSTKQNLHKASSEEIHEIDHAYPRLIKDMTPEGHEAAIRFLNHAWQAEKQHRDLISKMETGAKRFFWLLKLKFRKKRDAYYVCGTCGSTLTKLPEDKCPICGEPVSGYITVKMEQ